MKISKKENEIQEEKQNKIILLDQLCFFIFINFKFYSKKNLITKAKKSEELKKELVFIYKYFLESI